MVRLKPVPLSFFLFPGSPFVLRIGEPPDASKVRVFGPGIEDGVLYSFQSMFLVETHGAGAGQLAVRVRGPRGEKYLKFI